MNKKIQQNLQNIKITKNDDGSYKLTSDGRILAEKVSPEMALGVILSKAKNDLETSPEISNLSRVAEPAVVTPKDVSLRY